MTSASAIYHDPSSPGAKSSSGPDSGPQIWIKRDDSHSGLADGVIKIQNFEFMFPEALAQGSTVIVIIRGLQCNHMRTDTYSLRNFHVLSRFFCLFFLLCSSPAYVLCTSPVLYFASCPWSILFLCSPLYHIANSSSSIDTIMLSYIIPQQDPSCPPRWKHLQSEGV